MKPAPFQYYAPETLTAALTLLSEKGEDAKLLAGGQSLIPVMNFRLAQPAEIIDLNRVVGLDQISVDADGGVRIGAMVRQSTLEKSELIATHVPLLHQTMPYIAHPQIRNRGTIGGSLAHADPAAELPVLMVALRARFELQKVGHSRTVSATDFYIDLFETALEPDEMLTEIVIPPLAPRTGTAFKELARRHGDYAMAGVAVLLSVDEQEKCVGARIVFLNVGNKPILARQAAAMLVGRPLSTESIEHAVHHAMQHEIDPTGDVHASAAYKRHLAGVLCKRALTEAQEKL